MDNQGWIAIHRQLQDSDIWNKPHEWLKIWMFILLNVSYEDKRFKKGTYFFRYHWIADRTGTTYDQVRRCIDYLKVSHSIATQKATQGIIITVLNFAKYQDITKFKSQTENSNHATRKPHGSHNITNNVTTEQETNIRESRFAPPSIENVSAEIADKKYTSMTAGSFWNFYETKGWMVGKSKMKNWKSALAGWEARNKKENPKIESAMEKYARECVAKWSGDHDQACFEFTKKGSGYTTEDLPKVAHIIKYGFN